MEVVDNPREHAPEHQVRGLKSDAGERTELALAPQIDRNAGGRQQHRLGDQQNLRRVPDEHERRERHEDGVEVVAEQVGDPEHGVVDELAPAVAPNALGLYSEVTRIATVVLVEIHGYSRIAGEGEKGKGSGQRPAYSRRR